MWLQTAVALLWTDLAERFKSWLEHPKTGMTECLKIWMGGVVIDLPKSRCVCPPPGSEKYISHLNHNTA